MKKMLIATGVASLAVAAMPVVGVFAADVTGSTDTLEIKVNPTCSFTTGNQGETTESQTFTDTVLNGKKAAFKVGGNAKATHKFNVVCNDNDGWKVTAAGQDLAPVTAGNNHKITMVAGAVYAADSGQAEGQWSGALSGTGVIAGGYIPLPTQEIAAPIIATESASTDSSAFTVTYDAYVGTETAADTYRGTVTYSLSTL
ncbi:hypothetical protein IJH23_00065 [Candidatus Saccharibacteria bacterium]|nr:hypothetical protein [Candidatus Saccharibacteria bacterium]MBQ3470103.1 hypothetical protein [Candidatus Saccharibacteria bacterium]